MPSSRHLIRCTLLLVLSLGTGGCTLVKPVMGAVTGPIYAIGATGELPLGCRCDDGYGAAAFLIVSSAAGAVAGLVTGVISDFQVLAGRTDDPTRNWFNPFAVNS